MELGYSASNMAFGMGGGLLQKNNRDTHKFSWNPILIKHASAETEAVKNPRVQPLKRLVSDDAVVFVNARNHSLFAFYR